ncbi:hypothetical protein OG21DRAFT_1374904, partial [Imleria badia]
LSLRSGRSAWKGQSLVPFSNLKQALEDIVPIRIRTNARAWTILPNFAKHVNVGSVRFLVPNGKDYVPVTVILDMIDHKLGEFAH